MRKTYERDFKMKVVQEINAKKGTGKGKRQPDKADFYILEQENKKIKEENDSLKKFEVFAQRKK